MFQMISMGQLEMLLDGERDFVLLDVRSREEFQMSRLDGAVNIPLEELDASFGLLPRDRAIIIYCSHGGQSLMAARKLDRQGFFAVDACGGLAYYRGRHLI